MGTEVTKITAGANKRNRKYSSIMVWLLIIFLGVFTILNQQYFLYKSILLQFLITFIAVAILIYLLIKKTDHGLRFCEYWCGSVVELKKVTWPKKKETMQTAAAVVIMVIIMGLVLWTVDSILIRLVAWLLKKGGI